MAFLPAVVVRGLLPRLGLARAHGTDFRVHPSWLNRALIAAYRIEALVLRRVANLPVGLSVVALAQRPAG